MQASKVWKLKRLKKYNHCHKRQPTPAVDCRFIAAFDVAILAGFCYAEIVMDKRQQVILYGDTLVLASIRASLEVNPSFEVIDLDASQVTRQELLALNPDTIIFDIHSVQSQFPSDLIQHWAGLLIGINPDSNQVLLWTGHPMSELSVQDLVTVIQQHQSRLEITPKLEK